PARDTETSIDVDSVTLQNAITQTVMAASADEASPVLTGVLVQIDGNRLTLAATDRHRLAVKTLEVRADGSAPPTSVIVPARHLNEVARAGNPSSPTGR